jgi:transcriptional regulator with XRE-family HTH domain
MVTRSVTGREINAALRLRGLSQWDLAVKAGINPSSVSAALRGRENFGPEREERFARAVAELGLLEPVTPTPGEAVFSPLSARSLG